MPNLKSALTFFYLSLSLFFASNAFAQEPVKHLVGKGRNAFETNSWFVVKKSPVDVYPGASSSGPSSVNTKLGTLFFAKNKQNGRVLLAQYDQQNGWQQELGWVKESDVLVNLFHPMTIGEAIENNMLDRRNYASSQESSGLSRNNELFLRAVAQPNMLIKAGSQPGEQSGEAINTWSWYSVFDIVNFNGKPWILAGKNPQILTSRVLKDTRDQGAQDLLLGWLPLDKMTIWASNTVIELNTSKSSVSNRLNNNAPAKVYSQANKNSPTLFKEPLDQYWAGRNPDIKTIIDYDPIGISADVPRQIIIQNTPEWVEVASVGSLDNEINPSQLIKIKREVNRIATELTMLDIAFVVDATGSMGEEIKAVQAFLDDLSKKMQSFQKTGAPINVALAGETLQINSNLDISVSLVGFQDIQPDQDSYNTKVYFKKKNVVSDYTEISNKLVQIGTELKGGTEAIHDGMKRALENDMWRSESLQRIVVLIADEPGDSNDGNSVLLKMPSLSSAQLNVSPKLRSLSGSEQKKELTKVYSVYTGEAKDYAAFTAKVEDFSTEIHHIEGFNNSSGKADLLKILLYQLRTQQQSIGRKLGAFHKLLSGQASQSSRGADMSTLPGIEQLAIQQAVSRSGMSLSDLRQLTNQAYYQGFVPIDLVQGINSAYGQRSEESKAYRVRVMLTVDELRSLQDTTSKIATGLSVAVEQILQGDDGLFDNADDSSKQLYIAQLLLLVRDQVSGSATYQNDKAKLQNHAKQLVESIQTGRWSKDDSSFARLMKVPSSLPMKNDGFLSKPLREIINSRPDELMTIADNLNLKQIGLQRIIDNQTVPEDFRLVMTATTKKVKGWAFTNGTQSTVKYVYIPLSYIP
jgi:hypothetical protein